MRPYQTTAERLRPEYLTDTPLDGPSRDRGQPVPQVALGTRASREAARRAVTARALARRRNIFGVVRP